MANERGENFVALPVTDWDLVSRAAAARTDSGLTALDNLMRLYLPALKAHLVLKKKIPPDRADDLLQGFVAAKILDANLLGVAHPHKGKFRTILLTALDRYVISVFRQDQAGKRSPGRGMLVSLEELAVQPPTDQAASDVFDIAWAREVIAEALRRMKVECEGCGRESQWALFDCRVVAPLLEGADPVPYDQLIARFGFQSPIQASNSLVTAKRMFARCLRAVVREYTGEDDAVEKEIQDLMAILSCAST